MAVQKHAVTLYQTKFRLLKFTTIRPTRVTKLARGPAPLSVLRNVAPPLKRHLLEHLRLVDGRLTAVRQCAESSALVSAQNTAVQQKKKGEARSEKGIV